ncbi:hypothetical protein AJ87_02870 [Rhizobium yanglingense]|nr:hypothetical protein AJ87_02870 [Rhizobium yanglingense]
MKDTPADPNRSKVVSRDVRSSIKKVLPSIIRTILGNDKVVEYQPVNEGDEAAAEQATDYINYVVFPESDGYDAVQDAAHDALKLRNGVIRWWYDKKRSVQVSKHTGLDEQALVQLVADDDVEVLSRKPTRSRSTRRKGLSRSRSTMSRSDASPNMAARSSRRFLWKSSLSIRMQSRSMTARLPA